MLNNLNKDWEIHLKEELDKDYFLNLMTRVTQEYSNYTCFPPLENIFDSLNFCLLSKLKVVIIGQDPYHQQSQANGLSFSVGKDVKIPPSLNNIFKELNNDVNKPIPNNGDLTYLSKQGILLLNSCLSVSEIASIPLWKFTKTLSLSTYNILLLWNIVILLLLFLF